MRLMFGLVFIAASASCVAEDIGVVLAHPPVDAFFSCSEHFAGQFSSVGDALGTDCVPQRLVEAEGRMWLRAYEGDGSKNEQWFGWNMELLSPCECEIVRVHVNATDNVPGIMGKGRSSSITLRRGDGVHFLLAHVRDIRVKSGDSVKPGEAVALFGNNGFARSPHVHVAAWKESTPLQIRWDQSKMRMPPEFRE